MVHFHEMSLYHPLLRNGSLYFMKIYQQRTFILFYVHLYTIITDLTWIDSRLSIIHRCQDNNNYTYTTSFIHISSYCITILTFCLCKKVIILDERLVSNCSIIENIPPKGVNFLDFKATFVISVGFYTYFDLYH